ncbi:MAG: hypothetical protein VW405_15030 [Rhodospirillaceae bacterium]
MTRKERVEMVLDLVLGGASIAQAIGAVAQADNVQPQRVAADVRSIRWLVINESDVSCPLLDGMPPDVVVLHYGWSPEAEEQRARILAELGVSVSALPSVISWVPARTVDEDGEQLEVPAGWRALRVTTKSHGPRAAWRWQRHNARFSRDLPMSVWALAYDEPQEVPE